jgi:hypothetical protein
MCGGETVAGTEMPAAVLLNNNDPLFVFEHMMQHRAMMAVMAPLHRFSRLPYLLDPSYQIDIRAGPWNADHQQAHDDFASVIPHTGQNQKMADANLRDTESATWWTFTNHIQHLTANDAISQLRMTFPAW